MDDDDSFASSSDSSDDEFLTMKGDKGGRNQDREALIRKKLMESFYGKSLPADTNSDDKEEDDDFDDDEDNDDNDLKVPDSKDAADDEDPEVANDDLDSPYFDPEAYTSKLVLQGDVHQVLEVEEDLALQVRTLDSTMQTLVYENYSKFIDATDAIRSIGVNVHANEEGLSKLSSGIITIDKQSREVEDALGGLRDQVAEKLRIKRLLTRLDALLKLPTTLESQVSNGQYRLATKSYIRAHGILSKHSEGFESLKTIEIKCHNILEDMIHTIKRKLVYWSGQTPGGLRAVDSNDFDVDYDDDEAILRQNTQETEETEEWGTEPPNSVAEVFECAGTLVMVLPSEENEDERTTFDSGCSKEEYKSMALSATMRFLERVLDSHHVELQDAMFSTAGFDIAEDTYEAKLSAIGQPTTELEAAPVGSKLVPNTFLDHVLQGATLFGLSFNTGTMLDSDRLMLMDFVTEAFSSFLGHVRSVLLDQSMLLDPDDDNEDNGEAEADEDDGDAAYGEVSGAMTHLLRGVRELASGLALPEVGVDAEFASGLVEQAVEVTESMVRRRVAQKFLSLRLRVIQDCLVPFAVEAMIEQDDGIVEQEEGDSQRIVELVQKANVALSDGLQMVDDTVRSILTGGVVVSDLKGVDFAMVKEAVQSSCRRFAMWLAATLEVIAGGDDPKILIDAAPKQEDGMEEELATEEDPVNTTQTSMALDSLSIDSVDNEATSEKIDRCLDNLLDQLDLEVVDSSRVELAMALSEMCRLAEKSVMENINQSINSCVGGGRKSHKSSGIFQSSVSTARKLGDADQQVSDRFQLAASRMLGLYATQQGSEAASLLCANFYEMANINGEDLPNEPRPCVWKSLELAKAASIDCAAVYGGEVRAGPMPDLPEEESILHTGGVAQLSRSTLYGAPGIKGLQLDVERMFTEKVPAYPHPSENLEFARSAVVTMVLNIAFKALSEQARICTFSVRGYRQLQLDVAFLRFILPHYVKDDLEGTNSLTILENVLSDALSQAGTRCRDPDCAGQETFYDPVTGESPSIRSILRQYLEKLMSEEESDDRILDKFFIAEQGTGAA